MNRNASNHTTRQTALGGCMVWVYVSVFAYVVGGVVLNVLRFQ